MNDIGIEKIIIGTVLATFIGAYIGISMSFYNFNKHFDARVQETIDLIDSIGKDMDSKALKYKNYSK